MRAAIISAFFVVAIGVATVAILLLGIKSGHPVGKVLTAEEAAQLGNNYGVIAMGILTAIVAMNIGSLCWGYFLYSKESAEIVGFPTNGGRGG